jgi:hypothetical protein
MANSTLMDSLKSKLSGQPAPTINSGVQDDTQRTQSLLRTKLGKATTSDSSTPRISNLQEQQSAVTADAGLQQNQLQGILRAEQVGQQEDQIKSTEAEQTLDNKSKLADMQNAFELRSNDILNELERSDKTLTEERKAAKLEQLGFLLRLQDKDYLTNLERAGREARLNNELSFKEQMSKDIFAEDLDVFKDDLGFKEFINANQRDFEEMLHNMDLQSAEKLAKAKFKAEKTKAIWSGGASAITSGLGMRGNSGGGAAPTGGESMTGGSNFDYSTTT